MHKTRHDDNHGTSPGEVDARQHEWHTKRTCHHAIGEALCRKARPAIGMPISCACSIQVTTDASRPLGDLHLRLASVHPISHHNLHATRCVLTCAARPLRPDLPCTQQFGRLQPLCLLISSSSVRQVSSVHASTCAGSGCYPEVAHRSSAGCKRPKSI